MLPTILGTFSYKTSKKLNHIYMDLSVDLGIHLSLVTTDERLQWCECTTWLYNTVESGNGTKTISDEN